MYVESEAMPKRRASDENLGQDRYHTWLGLMDGTVSSPDHGGV